MINAFIEIFNTCYTIIKKYKNKSASSPNKEEKFGEKILSCGVPITQIESIKSFNFTI